jgi:hypothetical protein
VVVSTTHSLIARNLRHVFEYGMYVFGGGGYAQRDKDRKRRFGGERREAKWEGKKKFCLDLWRLTFMFMKSLLNCKGTRGES